MKRSIIRKGGLLHAVVTVTPLIVALLHISNSRINNSCHAFTSLSTSSINGSIRRTLPLIHSSRIETSIRPKLGHFPHIYSTIHSRPSLSSTSTSTSLSYALEDIIYNAQSTAASLASSSLSTISEPTTSSSFIPLAILYFAGLLTSFSPCSLGLLPLTMSYISSAADSREDKAVVLPTLAFASGLAVVFCSLGLASSFVGGVFGSTTSSDNIWGAFALASLSSGISIAMGLQLLELVNLPLPSLDFEMDTGQGQSQGRGMMNSNDNASTDSMYSEVAFDDDGNMMMPSPLVSESSSLVFDDDGNIMMPSPLVSESPLLQDATADPTSTSSDNFNSLFRTFLLGGSSALVASPCATPVLTSILAFVAGAQDPALGGLLLFIYTVGYSTPLLVVAASGGQALVNLQNANVEEDTLVGKLGQIVNPLTASVLIWYGVNGFLEAVFGDPSLAGLAPILN